MMLSVCGRRRSRNLFVKFLITLGIFLIISLIIRSDHVTTTVINEKDADPRLFCVLLNTHSSHELFVYMNNITWAKYCHKIGIVRYRRLRRSDDDSNIPRSPQYVNLWIRILDVIRQSISPYEYISNKDSLVIVPAPTFVFREKIFLLLHTSTNNSQSPLIIIHEQQEANAYILNGQSLKLVRNTELVDSCLRLSYPSARETHLWKCVKSSLETEHKDRICGHENCFIQYHHYELTLAHIKNGFCLQNNHTTCQSIALLHPITINDFLILEFFKYRLKPKSFHNLL